MQIKSISIAKLTIPLIRPFITAIRQTDHVEDIVVMIKTDCGTIGYGSAAATPLITGDSKESIISAIQNIIAPKLIGKNINDFNQLLYIVQTAIKRNSSAKAAVDIALHDLLAKWCNLPLYQLLGGATNHIETCITISVKEAKVMAEEAKLLVAQGFTTLKIKVGLNAEDDIERIQAIRENIDHKIKILVDANQGWNAKSAIQVIQNIEKHHLNVALVEQPVKADDLVNLKYVRDSVNSFIVADEACFSPQDALAIAKNNVSDGINIKLMKCGGLDTANAIYHIANSASIGCMVGCMLESPIGVAAMTSFAVSKPNILYADLDPIALIKDNPIVGGAKLVGNQIYLANEPGLGIQGFNQGLELVSEIK